jgi:hypothetical protein
MKITIVDGDDWKGLFVDGKCVLQDHRLEVRQVLAALDIMFSEVEADSEWLAENGQFPEHLDDVKLRKVSKVEKPKKKNFR